METCETVVDPKTRENSVVYLPAELATPASVEELQKRCNLQVKHFPKN